MTTLYKMNNLGTISWWEIEAVEHPLEASIIDQIDSRKPRRIGYNTWWGNDHRTQTRQTDNHQYTPASDKPSMFVIQQIETQIKEMISRKGYTRELPESKPALPMLAQTWADFINKAGSLQSQVKHWSSFYLQPKLDGIRCLATPLNLVSRRNLPISSVPHIEMAMNLLISHSQWGNIKLDGELYFHGADLQTIQSATSRKSYDPIIYRHITYQVFDIIDLELPFIDRLSRMEALQQELHTLWNSYSPPEELQRHYTKVCPIQFVPTTIYNEPTDTAEALKVLHSTNKRHRDEGYEGTILRNPTSLYQPNYRSFDLIKYKEFADAEFIIIDVVEAKNKMGTFVCSTLTGKTFKCTPAWTSDRKRQILRYKDNYVGRQLTVKYERISKDGIPLKPIGITIRD